MPSRSVSSLCSLATTRTTGASYIAAALGCHYAVLLSCRVVLPLLKTLDLLLSSGVFDLYATDPRLAASLSCDVTSLT